MKVQTATVYASSASGLALAACLLAMWSIHSDVQGIWRQLDGDIDEFRGITDDLWKDIIQLGARHSRNRFRRETHEQSNTSPSSKVIDVPSTLLQPGAAAPAASIGAPPGGPLPPDTCHCKTGADNRCPAGQPGPKGIVGKVGPPGFDGRDGIPGKDADDVTPAFQDVNFCFNCPAGLQGAPGPMGKSGQRGMKGADGQRGMPGSDGQPGSPGEPGPPGPPGPPGIQGFMGEKGRDAQKAIGSPGKKGLRGERGPPGPAGNPGHDAPQGLRGAKGLPGGPGLQGPPGPPGPAGYEGPVGRPGRDAEYCPCPQSALYARNGYKFQRA